MPLSQRMGRSAAGGLADQHGSMGLTTPAGAVMRWLMLIVVLLLGGCGEGYSTPQAVIRLEASTVGDMDAAAKTVASKLLALGFEEYPPKPRPDFMQQGLPPALIWSDAHATTFVRDGKAFTPVGALRVSVTPYPDANTPRIPYSTDIGSRPAPPFLELGISESRPQGFSEEGIAIHAEITKALEQHTGKLVIPSLPKRGDDQEYLISQIKDLLTTLALWLVVWAVFMTIIGGLAMVGIRRLFARTALRRAALIFIGVAFVTPVSTPTAIVQLLMPSILLFLSPEALVLMFQSMGATLPIMFALSLALSTLTAFIFIRDRPKISRTTPNNPGT